MKLWKKKPLPGDPGTPATTTTASLASSHGAHDRVATRYTEIDEPERFSPVPHKLAVVMQSYEAFERDIFNRIDAIHATGGLDLGHFDIFDGYLLRKRASVEASLVQERNERSKTASRLTGIHNGQYVREAKRVETLRAEHDHLLQLRTEIIAELRGPDRESAKGNASSEHLPLPTPLPLPDPQASVGTEPASAHSVLDFPPHPDPTEEVS
ncbi:hypothetical protein [Prescottella equi]|uniref:hypothetical protein n=1 Tax=Rhodococcus hoagii TaxID=43767 RepID=UPI000A114059|nr:hypothetical protein [Prescottella equi]ORM02888.1 hypothetical protein A5N72_17025 [Prescottella equi]